MKTIKSNIPMLTIITVCKNAKETIPRTIESVLNQTFQSFEYIVVDGLSTDNTIEIVDSYKCKFGDKLTIISEKDKGIYDAMNKGVDLASGDYCIFLNSGDLFYNNDVLKIMSKLLLNEYDIVYGDTIYKYDNKYMVVYAKDEKYINYRRGMEFCHQSTFIKTSYIKEHKYSLDYKIAGDYLFFLNAYINNKKFKHCSNIVSIFDMNGISSSNGSLSLIENTKIQYIHGFINFRKYICVRCINILKRDIKSLIPKSIVNKRQASIMNRITRNWKEISKETNLTIGDDLCIKE